jgi:acyl-CoA thioester hydrolase
MESEFDFVSDAKIRVRYEETDQMGYVYHGKYFTWFEVGRTELFRALELPYIMLEKRGIRLPVTETDCKYRSAARYDDIITVRTVVVKLTPTRIQFSYQLLSEEGQVMAYGSTSHAIVDSTGRPMNLSKKDPELWNLMFGRLSRGD